jgi:hypothetical protein
MALASKKVLDNPALAVKLTKLNNGVERYLNQYAPKETTVDYLKGKKDEESRLRAVIRKQFPEREPEFDLALHTGMRFQRAVRSGLALRRFHPQAGHYRVFESGEARIHPAQHNCSRSAGCAAQASPCGQRRFRRTRLRRQRVGSPRLVASSEARSCHCAATLARSAAHLASRLVMADVNILTVQKLMRHETLAMTLRYSHLAPSHLQELSRS